MACPPRYRLPGVPQHVVQRGHNRQPVFFHPDDFGFYRATLYEVAGREEVAVYAYALMTNHVHLLLKPARVDSLERCMQTLNRRYGQFVNANHGRSGTLWEGRYRSSVIQTACDLAACHAYIELNPVRAGIVTCPERYPWSSAHHYLCGPRDALVTDSPTYLSLADTLPSRMAVHRSILSAGIDDEVLARIRTQTQRGGVLGSEGFREEVEAMLRVRVPGAPRGRPRKRGDQ